MPLSRSLFLWAGLTLLVSGSLEATEPCGADPRVGDLLLALGDGDRITSEFLAAAGGVIEPPSADDGLFAEASFFQPAPVLPPAPAIVSDDDVALMLSSGVYLGAANRSLLSQTRQLRAATPAADVVLGSEAQFRVTTDMGNLLQKSPNARGVSVQSRAPLVTDPRVRGDRIGRLVASGSYWIPARQDLDTALSKVDSRLIENLLVIKGPYAVIYGPGFDFVDFQLWESPRSHYPDRGGSTSLEYKTNGAQWYGRQTVWGSGSDYGFRVGYGHRTGSDYRAGDGFELPTSYKNANWDVALGRDFSDGGHLEFNYLRLDQSDVELPGVLFDLDFLVTDAYELRYVLEDQPAFDRYVLEGWYNRTRFEGNTFGAGKNRQIPTLVHILSPFDLFGVPGSAITDVDAMSTGYRMIYSWGDPDIAQLNLGTDLIFVKQSLNDIEDPTGVLNPVLGVQNYPIPPADSADVGLFFEQRLRLNDCWQVNIGGRVDLVEAQCENTSDFFDFTGNGYTEFSQLTASGLDQNFTLWSLFVTAERSLTDCVALTGGVGYAERPPTLTELFAGGSFIGSLQPGLTSLQGDPELDPERRLQVDLGIRGDHEHFRYAVNGFYAWVRDLITYDSVFNWNPALGGTPLFPYDPGQEFQRVTLTNTDFATLAGFEVAAERNVTGWLSGFAVVSFVEGRDHTRNTPSRLGTIRRSALADPPTTRSGVILDDEPLPGIPPLDARLGLRLFDAGPCRAWGAELEARVVDNQDRVALSLFEALTPGFTIWNLRGYWQPYDNLLVFAGVENFTDKFYREHLDYRSGLGVYQPGVNFYFSTELLY